MQESRPKNHIRKVHTGIEGSSCVLTVKTTSSTGRSSGVVGVESKSSVFSSLNSSAISRFEPVTKVQTLEFKIFFHILAGKR
ncbi:hypothetical protein SUGI_0591050 [Cryptomeria japonica]|nr:hypothetical protein SUGI_0591050 [Cryptomeria japonica]